MADDSDIEWLAYRAAIDRAHKVAGDRGIGTKLRLEHMFAGRIRALIKLAVIEHPKSDPEERRDWCPPPSFWADWKGEQQSDDVPELGRFVAVRSVFHPSIRYDHYRTEAHGVRLSAMDVSEWFPTEEAEPSLGTPGETTNGVVAALVDDQRPMALDLPIPSVSLEPPEQTSIFPDSATDRSGGPGAPSSMHIVEEMMRRRINLNQEESSMVDEAQALATLFNNHEQYKHLRRVAPKSIKNRLGSVYRKLRAENPSQN